MAQFNNLYQKESEAYLKIMEKLQNANMYSEQG